MVELVVGVVELAVGVGRVGSWCGANWQLVWGELAVGVGQTGVGTVGKFKFKSSLLTVLLLDLIIPRPSQQELVSSPDPPCPCSPSSYFLPEHMTSCSLLLSPVCWSFRC